MTFSPTSQEAYRDKSKGADPFDGDLAQMVLLWNSDSSDRDRSRAMALEIADRNRETARSEK